jgi:hypothetical protein
MATIEISKAKRDEPRIPLVMPVVIERKEAGGNNCNEETFTENVSRMGACVITQIDWQVGEIVTLLASRGNFECQALIRIVWIDKKDKQKKAGLQFLKAPKNWVVN